MDHDAPRRLWSLDPSVIFMNHGSFGACPLPVLARQAELRARLESEPVRFLVRELEGLLDEARAELASFVGAAPDELVFVANATTGVNTILASLPLRRGDRVLVTTHAYNACHNAVAAVCERTGAEPSVVALPFPLRSADEIVTRLLEAVTPRTRLLLLDHVTSPTGLVLPVAPIVRELARQGVDVLVDGAHAPGMLPLDLAALGAPFYTGNCHKWLCAPKGAGFLYVRRDRQAEIRPLVVSHGRNSPRADRSRFLLEFDWTGTADPTAALCVPAALRFLGSLLPGGWPALMESNRALVRRARARLCAALGVDEPAPLGMLGSLASVPLPPSPPGARPSPLGIDPLQDRLFHEQRIEVPVMAWPAPPARLLRVSAQAYNRIEDYEALAAVLPELLRQEGPSST